MKAWILRRILFLLIPLTIHLLGCANGLNKSPRQNLQNIDYMGVCSTNPSRDAHDGKLDQQIYITFNQKIDAHSAYAFNFVVTDNTGNPIPFKVDSGESPWISSYFVKPTSGPCAGREVSEIKLTMNQYLSPFERYFVRWKRGTEDTKGNNIDPRLAGVRSLEGAPLKEGGTFFTTGNDYTTFNNGFLEVISISPGHLLTKSPSFGNDTNILDAIGNYVSVTKNGPITVTFNQAVAHSVFDAGKSAAQLATDFPRTLLRNRDLKDPRKNGIHNFPGTAVFVFDSNTPYNELVSHIPDFASGLDSDEWNEFLDSQLYRPLRMTARSADRRHQVIFEMEPNCDVPEECLYPENKDPKSVGQVVVIVLQGWEAVANRKALRNNIAMGGFFHYSGFEAGAGFPSIDDILGGLGQ